VGLAIEWFDTHLGGRLGGARAMRIALLAGIRGNSIALDAILRDATGAGAEAFQFSRSAGTIRSKRRWTTR
jgi:hypothetical protein